MNLGDLNVTRIAMRTCSCCGAIERKMGCIIGYTCNCNHWRTLDCSKSWCFRCHKCGVHCKCQQGMLSNPQEAIETLHD